MRVWIDQELCTGDGLCEELCPEIFAFLDDGLSYVKQGDAIFNHPGGKSQMVTVSPQLEKAVAEAADECPGECIIMEADL